MVEKTEKKRNNTTLPSDFGLSSYYAYMTHKMENSKNIMPYKRILQNISSKKCLKCEGEEKYSKQIIIGENLVNFSILCDNCNIPYSGFKIPMNFYKNYLNFHDKNLFRPGLLIDLVRHLREKYRKKNSIKQAYYLDWEKKIINGASKNVCSKMIYNWDHICYNCHNFCSKYFNLIETENIDGLKYYKYEYRCTECKNLIGLLQISENSLNKTDSNL